MNKKQKIMLIRILTAAALLAVLHVLPVTGWMRFGLYLIPYLIAGYDILRKALKGIQNRQVFDENFLMAVATVGAIALALYERSGDYTEAIAVMLFYQIGEWFQSYAVGKSRRNITALMDIRPDYANIEQNGQLTQVDPDDVPVGAVIVVQPGEKVPLDGVVLEGTSTLNTAALTGESLPRDVTGGDEIVSGCINMTGVLKIRTTRAFGESTVSKILELVENSSSHKSKSENFISKFARVYTPAVCGAALALAVLPPVLRLLTGLDGDWGTWLYPGGRHGGHRGPGSVSDLLRHREKIKNNIRTLWPGCCFFRCSYTGNPSAGCSGRRGWPERCRRRSRPWGPPRTGRKTPEDLPGR